MSTPNGAVNVASVALFASGVLHVLAITVAGIVPEAIAFIVIGLVYCGVAWWLRRESLWLAMVVYVVMLIGSVAAFASMGSSPIPSWWLVLIIVADLTAAIALFGFIWRPVAST